MSWATGGIERRIRKLEGPKGTDLEQLTDDEHQLPKTSAKSARDTSQRLRPTSSGGLRSRPRQNIRLIWNTAAKTGGSVRGETITFRRCFIGMALREIWTSQT